MGGRISWIRIVASIIASASLAFGGSYHNIEDMSGWKNCGACAGINASGPVGTFWMKQHVSSPSLDGSAAHFYIGGKSYADALWWKQLGANNGATHFTYDLYFYIQTPQISQALEFDVNQSTGGHKYIFGAQCTARNHDWWVWDAVHGHWVNTYIGCSPGAYKWNHLTIEVQRVGTQTHFIAITLNGHKAYVNKYYGTKSSSASEINVAFQMDLNSAGQGYSTWLDKVSLVY